MMRVYEILLGGVPIHIQMGSLFHGILMEGLTPDFVQRVHCHPQNPYTQYLYKREDQWIWRICALHPEACEEIERFFRNLGAALFVEHKQWSVQVLEKSKGEELQIDTLIQKAYGTSGVTGSFPLRFLTPTSFKSQDRYQNMPRAEWIMKSLVTKFNHISPRFVIEGEEVLEDLYCRVSIGEYKLRSISYHLENTTIPAFMGQLTLKVHGPKALKELVSLLISISPYTGIGMKTSLGMGGVQLGK